MSIEAMKMAWWALCLTNNEAVPDDIEERREAAIEALRQAIEQAEKPAVKSYCGGKPNYCTPEETPEVTPEVTGEVTGEVQCKTHPDAPHGFDRNASHAADRYVCECESWEPVDAVNMSQECVDETAKREHEPVAWFIQYEDSHEFVWSKPDGWRAKQALEIQPLYTAPPKKEWVGLTDEEIQAERHKLDLTAGWTYNHFARAIEAKLKEKNGG